MNERSMLGDAVAAVVRGAVEAAGPSADALDRIVSCRAAAKMNRAPMTITAAAIFFDFTMTPPSEVAIAEDADARTDDAHKSDK